MRSVRFVQYLVKSWRLKVLRLYNDADMNGWKVSLYFICETIMSNAWL